jgi:hypothetical protein
MDIALKLSYGPLKLQWQIARNELVKIPCLNNIKCSGKGAAFMLKY